MTILALEVLGSALELLSHALEVLNYVFGHVLDISSRANDLIRRAYNY